MKKNRLHLDITGTGEFKDFKIKDSTDGMILAFVKDESSNPNHLSPMHSRDIGFGFMGDVTPRDMLNMVCGILNALYHHEGAEDAEHLINLAHEVAKKAHAEQTK